MRIFTALVRKEFLQLARNKALMAIILLGPPLMLAIIPFSFGNMPKADIVVVDKDATAASRLLTGTFNASYFFEQVSYAPNMEVASHMVETSEKNAAVYIPQGFEKGLEQGDPPALHIAVDASNAPVASQNLYFITGIIRSLGTSSGTAPINTHILFNDDNNSRAAFILSMLMLLCTVVGVCMICIMVITEKESGILHQLGSTTLNMSTYMWAKMVLCGTVCLFNTVTGYFVCHWIFGLGIMGSPWEQLLLTTLFMLPVLGIGLLIASAASNQRQAIYMLVFFLVMLIMLSTMFTSLKTMPVWAQNIRYINPISVMLDATRMIMFKGYPLATVWHFPVILACQGAVFLSIALTRIGRSKNL